MDVELFNFDLPKERIALRPAEPRGSARMLVVAPFDVTKDRAVSDLSRYLSKGDVLVFNDTKVIPARLFGKRGEVKVEVTLHKQLNQHAWAAFAKPAKRLAVGDVINFGTLKADVLGREGPEVLLKFNVEHSLMDVIKIVGEMPLPPYIASQRAVDERDLDDYQTVYAAKEGAVAAPTAGLHFHDDLLAKISELGVEMEFLTLHVGAGTFLPVKVEDTAEHVMHSEWGEISPQVADKLNRCRKNGGKIVAVGTTALRLLESAADADGTIQPFSGDTDIFIQPGYKFKAVDVLFTNFHLPKSTLFMLVSAFAGLERMQAAYKHAVDENYRFYSYGDSSLLFLNK
jgi:S-adenosylmethionine:tRNA ribosyltransferase-isomerase